MNSKEVEYLLVDGYAVGYHGYPRATVDMDIWIAMSPANAERLIAAVREFGFAMAQMSPALFLEENRIIRMGVPPFRIELLTTISGMTFAEGYADRVVDEIDGVEVNLLSLPHLKINKRASGRHKDLNDLENLP